MPPVLITYYTGNNRWDNSPFARCSSLIRVNWGDCELGATLGLYYECSSLDYYDGILPAGLKKVDNAAFFGTTLTRMIFPEGIEEFGGSIFRGNEYIRYVELPLSTKSLYTNNIFHETHRNGIYVVIKAINPPILNNPENTWWTNKVYWYVPDESVEAYKAEDGWNSFADNIHPISELPENYKAMGTL